jgi:hypothetical protein
MITVDKWNPSEFGNPASGAHYVVEYLDPNGNVKFDKYYGQACYISVSHNYGRHRTACYSNPIAIHSAIVGGVMKKDMDDYLSFIFSPKLSPWASIVPDKGLDWVSPKKQSPYVTIPVTKETPSQILFNLLFAVRLGHDIPQIVRRWNWLTNKGWTEYEALFTSVYYGLDGNNKTVTNDPWSNHNAFNSNRLIDLKAIEAKKPRLTFDYKLKDGYYRVTDIWDKPDGNRSSMEIYNLKNLNNKYTGVFAKAFKERNYSDSFQHDRNIDNSTLLSLKDEILAIGRS